VHPQLESHGNTEVAAAAAAARPPEILLFLRFGLGRDSAQFAVGRDEVY
jgi:hypothetical protein